MINYTQLKAAMAAKGLAVSAGSGWAASDEQLYLQFLYFNYNALPPVPGCYGLQYTSLLLASDPAFPGAGGTPTRTLQSIAITGTATAAVGATSQLTATGTYDVAPLTEDITSSVTWTSGTPANATVAGGLVTGVAVGTSDITASLGDVTSAPTTFTVTAARTVTSVTVSGPTTVAEGATINLTATANYNVAPLTQDVTATATWTSGTPANATVAAGVVTGVAAGSSNITAAFGGQTSTAHAVTVTTP